MNIKKIKNKLSELKDNKDELSYRQLCDYLDMPYYRGCQKDSQLKELERLCRYKKMKTKYVILEVYDDIRDKTDNRIGKKSEEFLKSNPNFLVNIEDMYKGGVYKVQLNDIIYIGQTSDFHKRFNDHKYNSKKTYYDCSDLIKNGATFEILKIEENKIKRLELEKEWILKYKNNDKFNCVKSKYKTIKVYNKDYNRAIELLSKNNINFALMH